MRIIKPNCNCNYLWLLCVALLTFTGCEQLSPEDSSAEELFRNKKVLALVKAAESGDIKTIDRLVQEGVDVNSRGKSGATPLLRALVSRNKEGFKALLKHGADPDLQDYRGDTITHYAAEAKETFWLKEVLAHGANPDSINTGHPYTKDKTPIYYAIYKERMENAKLLINAGANLNHHSKDARPPLHTAAEHAEYGIVLALLEGGADYSVKDMHGKDLIDFDIRGRSKSPFGKGKKQWFDKVVTFLEAKGVDLSE